MCFGRIMTRMHTGIPGAPGMASGIIHCNENKEPVGRPDPGFVTGERSRCFRTCWQVNFSGTKERAEDGTRTRYLQLGKLSLYQVSYFRLL